MYVAKETKDWRGGWIPGGRCSVSVFYSLCLLLIFPLEETSSTLGNTATYLSPLQWHTHTLFATFLTHTHIKSLIRWSLICAPVSGRGFEWQYGIPGGTERCGDRHPNPLSQQTPKHRKTRLKKGIKKRRRRRKKINSKIEVPSSLLTPSLTTQRV